MIMMIIIIMIITINLCAIPELSYFLDFLAMGLIASVSLLLEATFKLLDSLAHVVICFLEQRSLGNRVMQSWYVAWIRHPTHLKKNVDALREKNGNFKNMGSYP